MPRSATGLLISLALVLSSGCATIFTGTSQTIHVATEPAGSYVVVVGTPMAPVILAARNSTATTRKVISLLGPIIPEGARAKLQLLDVDELITKLVVWAKLDKIPPELVGHAEHVPAYVRNQLLDLIGVKAFGLSPISPKLKKGQEYAVLTWREGHKARTAAVDMKFNWVVVVNVFNLFLGVPIDILTGAWFNLTPSKIELTLPPIPGS